MNFSDKKIQYKINKYKSKFNLENNLESKLIYGRKYLQYLKNNIPNGISNSNNQSNQLQTGGNIDQINATIAECLSIIEQLNTKVTQIKPTFDLIETMDSQIKTLNPGYPGYSLPQDLINYYLDSSAQCGEIVSP